MLTNQAYITAAACLKMLAQPMRLKIVDLLLSGPKSVGELSELCEASQNLTSEHLKLLRLCGLLRANRSGRTVTYEIAEIHLKDILKCVHSKFGEKNGNKSKRIKRKTK
jgi:DNA-binding transcriptional ArsR family regulator